MQETPEKMNDFTRRYPMVRRHLICRSVELDEYMAHRSITSDRSVRGFVMLNKGRLNHTIFRIFDENNTLKHLRQLRILGTLFFHVVYLLCKQI